MFNNKKNTWCYNYLRNLILLLIISVVSFGLIPVAFAQEAVCGNGILEGAEECDDGNNIDGDGCSSTCQFEDKTPPVTTKQYIGANLPSQLEVSSCNGNVTVNGHIISTSTAVLLQPDEDASTFYFILVPAECENGDDVQYVGLRDNNIYTSNETCALAVEGGQDCVVTFWNITSQQQPYVQPFTIQEGSIHKICFFSRDLAGNLERPQCQVVGVDNSTPITRKTYGEPNEARLIEVPVCEGDPVPVNGHLITTQTTITLDATDPEPHASGVDETEVTVLVPSPCRGETQWVGQQDHNIYANEGECQIAVDNESTQEPETQQCVQTEWQVKEELGENPFDYNRPFVIPQESTHKICFASVDNVQNQEDVHCQVVLVDDNAPTINSASVDHKIIDIETYSGGDGDLYFADPKCTMVTVNASDTHEIDEVQVGVKDVLNAMYENLEPSKALDDYFADMMHDMPAAELGDDGLYRYWFCPGKHIYHLYSMDVLSYDNFTKFLMEDLVLGEFELPIWVNDTTGKETHTSVNVTVVDLTVPLEIGWNLRSTPIRLEGNEFWSTDWIDAVLGWNSSSQSWYLVTDNSIVPLNALYIHATDRNQIGYIFERDLTSPPVRNLDEQWNLVGMALPLDDYWTTPSYCDNPFDGDSYDDDGEYGDYYSGVCYLTYLSSDSKNTRDAFLAVIYDADGNRALRVVISPQQSLSYGDDWASWYFYQYVNEYIPRITSGGADPTNSGFGMINFGGYWAFMQNDALWPGFTTTPLPLYGD